jgi:D-3-phosphoglycerate dehydrogenase / 2-oxoglutarate reductase
VGSGRPVVCLSPSFGLTSGAAVEAVEAAGGRLVRQTVPRDQWTEDFRSTLTEAAALIVGTQTIDAALIEAAPHLTVIAKHGAGVDNIDIEAATAAGIAVTSAPGANATAVAELVLGLVIGLARGILGEDRRVRRGEWRVRIGKALEQSTLGIVGMGRIGRLVATRALAFDMEVLAYDVVPAAPDDASPWTFVPLEQLLERSDFVSLHLPLLPETRNLVDAAALARMKPTAYLINAARGGVVDERALADALAGERLAGAALDVFEGEPIGPDHPLVALDDRTVLTPHMAGYTDRALAVTSEIVAASVVAALEGTLPPHTLNQPDPWRGRAR